MFQSRWTAGNRPVPSSPGSVPSERRGQMGARRWWVTRPVLVSMAVAAAVAGCNNPLQNTSVPMLQRCAAGQTVWNCTIQSTDCYMSQLFQTCAVDKASAVDAANAIATYAIKPKNPIMGTSCVDTLETEYIIPSIRPQGEPTCIITTDDNTCQTCAKGTCCNQYVACFDDINCSCMVSCLYDGLPAATCTSMDACGSLSAASINMASCIGASCSTPCVTMGGMLAGTSTCDGAGGGSSSTGTGTSCTPGANLAGNSCYSDADCESCYCNTTTMLCE
jgi:hypothetical protein